MNKFYCFLILFCGLFAPPAFAWNEFGHMLIAELALQKLDPKLQRKIESESFKLIKKQASEKRLYLMRAYPDSSAFAQLSVFADDYRKQSVQDLYAKFGQNVPAAFAEVAAQDTSKWHYKNQAYTAEAYAFETSGLPPKTESPAAFEPLELTAKAGDGLSDGQQPILRQSRSKQCNLAEPVDVAWAIEKSKEAFEQAESDEDRVLALALLIHFVSDAHQPLHGISRVDEDCESDRGGNRFCVIYRGSSLSCETNLHAFWDAGVGFFESFDRMTDAVEFVARVELDDREKAVLDPDEWLAEGFRKARFIYSIKDGSGGDSFYIKEGQIISYERIALAADRLAQILDQLY